MVRDVTAIAVAPSALAQHFPHELAHRRVGQIDSLAFGLREDALPRLTLSLGEQREGARPLPRVAVDIEGPRQLLDGLSEGGELKKRQGLTGRKSWSGKGEFAGACMTTNARSVA